MKPALLNQENLLHIQPAEPLWQRLPTRDEEGHLLGDFMMLIPGLNKKSQHEIKATLDKLNKLLHLYETYVVFAEMNLKINILWVSHQQRPGIGLELAAAIHALLPDAKLVAERHE